MKEATGDLWTFNPPGSLVWRGVPTNGVVRGSKLIMGAGVAKDAKQKFPELPQIWGKEVKKRGNIPYFGPWYSNGDEGYGWGIFSFPTKNHYGHKSDINLITGSATYLAAMALKHPNESYVLPRPGTGLGKLDWEEVKIPLLALLPDNVYVVSK